MFGRRQRIFSFQLLTAVFDLSTKFGVVIITVERLDKALTVRIDYRQEVSGSIDRQYVSFDRSQSFAASAGIREQVNTVTEHSGT
ncbi:hypothetical protein D9M71_795100 [compost metagenome]